MTNPQKVKGTTWERDVVKLLNAPRNTPVWKRIPGSGAIGTILDLPILKGDLMGQYDFIPFKMIGEAKVGYGGTQMSVHKEWFDKIRKEADQNYAMPIVLLKFEKARTGVRHVVALDIDAWESLLTYIEKLKEELDKTYAKGNN